MTKCFGGKDHNWSESFYSQSYGCHVQACPRCDRVRQAPIKRKAAS